jgi:hypothetical protein
MVTLAFIKMGVLAYLILWGLSILTEHYMAGRSESDRRRLLKLQKICKRMVAFRLNERKTKLHYQMQHPANAPRTPLNPALRDGGPTSCKYTNFDSWKTRYYTDDDDQPTFPSRR